MQSDVKSCFCDHSNNNISIILFPWCLFCIQTCFTWNYIDLIKVSNLMILLINKLWLHHKKYLLMNDKYWNMALDILFTVHSYFQPIWWEYIWCLSLLFSFLGLAAIKRNNIKQLRRYMYGITLLGFGPLLYCILYYCGDVWRYLSMDENEDDSSEVEIDMWQVSFEHQHTYCTGI